MLCTELAEKGPKKKGHRLRIGLISLILRKRSQNAKSNKNLHQFAKFRCKREIGINDLLWKVQRRTSKFAPSISSLNWHAPAPNSHAHHTPSSLSSLPLLPARFHFRWKAIPRFWKASLSYEEISINWCIIGWNFRLEHFLWRKKRHLLSLFSTFFQTVDTSIIGWGIFV